MRTKVFKQVVFMAFFSLISIMSNGQITKQQAISIVMNSVVGNQSDSVNVYIDSELQSGEYYVLSPFDSIASTYSDYWLFFIDEQPEYLWGHECSYVLVNYTDGSNYQIKKQLPPFNYNFFLEQVSVPFNFTKAQFDFTIDFVPDNTTQVNSDKYAVLFCGGDGGSGFMWSALSHMYCGLLEHGFPAENIFVLSYDGTAGPETNQSLDLNNDLLEDILPVPCSSEELG